MQSCNYASCSHPEDIPKKDTSDDSSKYDSIEVKVTYDGQVDGRKRQNDSQHPLSYRKIAGSTG